LVYYEVPLGAAGDVLRYRLLFRRASVHRRFSGLSRELAALGHRISPAALSHIEQGYRRVSIEEVVALASALGVEPGTLLLTSSPVADAVEMATLAETPVTELEAMAGELREREDDLDTLFKQSLLRTPLEKRKRLGYREPDDLLIEYEAVRVQRERVEVSIGRRDS
jgi:transcriptional regulator with XRE-family HTH domain